MKTATEMENYIRKNQTGYASFSPKHFKLVEEALLSDEEVILPLLSSQSGNNEKAVVFTNKNMIVARKSIFDTYTIVVSLDQIISVTKDLSDLFEGEIHIETLDKRFRLYEGKKVINKLYPQITEFLDNYKNKQQKSQSSPEISIADELQKYANLMNQGVITKEEFDCLKKDLLGLKTEVPKAVESVKSPKSSTTASVDGFKMVVSDVFNIKGRGNVLTGTVENDSISLGDNVDIFAENGDLIEKSVTVIGIEHLGKLEKRANPGDAVGILLKLRLPQSVHKDCYIKK